MQPAFFARPGLPALLLRTGLALVLTYAAVSSLVTPDDWIGYLPRAATELVDGYTLLALFSVFQLGLVLWLASGRHLHIAGLVCAATFAGIVAGNLALLAITFRDVAMVFASLALASLAYSARPRVNSASKKL